MKHLVNIFLFLIMSFMVSCYGDLPLDYPDEIDPEIVIECVLTDDTSSVDVFVSETISLNDTTGDFKGINDAKVSISDDLGNSRDLILRENGKYSTNNFEKQIGATYTLEVQVGEKLFQASEKMHPNNIVDTIVVEYFKDRDYYDDGLYVVSSIKVNENEKQFFRLILSVNDTVFSDYTDLMLFETSLLANETEVIIPYAFNSGDVAILELFSFSEDLYRYWNSYYQITTGFFGNPTAPSQNPPSNISGGCLGYFQVSSVQTYLVEIP